MMQFENETVPIPFTASVNASENYVPSPSFVQILQFMLDLCYNEEFLSEEDL